MAMNRKAFFPFPSLNGGDAALQVGSDFFPGLQPVGRVGRVAGRKPRTDGFVRGHWPGPVEDETGYRSTCGEAGKSHARAHQGAPSATWVRLALVRVPPYPP